MLGRDHPGTLTTRSNIASWTGQTGDARGHAAVLALLPDQERVLGPQTTPTRSPPAATSRPGPAQRQRAWGNCGCPPLLPDQERVLGHDHPNTLTSRNNIASWTGTTGNARGGSTTLLRAVAGPRSGCSGTTTQHAHHPLQHRALDRQGGQRTWRCNSSPHCCRTRSGCWGADHQRRSPPAATSHTGPVRRAMRVGVRLSCTALLPDRERVLGHNHPDTLTTRHNIADWTGEVGDARGHCNSSSALLPDQERVLGRDHPDTLTTRHNIASWTGETGEARGRAAVHGTAAGPGAGAGRDHPTRSRPATTSRPWTGETGDTREALRLFSRTAPGPERVLGRDHPDTLTTRSNIASWTGETGERVRRCGCSGAAAGPGAGAGARPPRHAHHPQQHRVLDRRDGRGARGAAAVRGSCCRTRSGCWGATTPTRSPPAATSRPGPARRATRGGLRLFSELLPDRERVLGRDHPDTLTTRHNIASWTGKTGDVRERCGCSRRCCRTGSGCWAATTPTRSPPATTSRAGPARRATRGVLRLFTELLPDRERVLGRDHPDTLATLGYVGI